MLIGSGLIHSMGIMANEFANRSNSLAEHFPQRERESKKLNPNGTCIRYCILNRKINRPMVQKHKIMLACPRPTKEIPNMAGYFCSVCECVVKDSANYLDHINGKKHQRALGMSMRVERASLQQVQDRFEILKKRKVAGSFTEQDLDNRILKQQQEEEERKRQRRERKKEKKKEKATEEDLDDCDQDVAAMMGFGGFGSSKK